MDPSYRSAVLCYVALLGLEGERRLLTNDSVQWKWLTKKGRRHFAKAVSDSFSRQCLDLGRLQGNLRYEMPITNRIHNHLEIGSLVLNFALFDTALLATSGQGSNVDNVATVSLVLDLVRVVAFLALGGYGVYENRANLFGLTCQSGLSHVDTSEESALAGYTALVSVAPSSEETADAPVAASTSSSNAGSKLEATAPLQRRGATTARLLTS